MPTVQPLQVAVTGVGIASSLGYRAPSALAAARAGVSRPSLLDVPIVPESTGDPEPVKAHVAPDLALGFEGPARLLRLLELALRDLRDRHIAASDSPLMVILPPANRAHDIPGRDEPYENARPAPPAIDLDRFRSQVQRIANTDKVTLVTGNRLGAIDALSTVNQWLQDKLVERCIICAVDSLMDAATIQWLLDQDRLKHRDNPVGLQPGEASCALLLERSGNASRPALSYLTALARATDAPLHADEPWLGRAIDECIDGIAADAPFEAPELICDLNGEEWRSHDFGAALSLARRSESAVADAKATFPAIAFGDTYNVAVALGIATASHLFQRRATAAGDLLVLASCESGDRVAVRCRHTT